ncbi:MAG: amidophosphoribosyltransferase, partial [Muribaculaceae bacterium]|nr:amidophosphoribosyltransferase [Muribaculaceae bacterium]
VGALISEGATYVDGIENVFRHVKGSCSMLLLTADGIIAARDALGRTPVLIARKHDAMAISSESCAFPNLGFGHVRDLGPGEIVLITPEGDKVLRQPGDRMQVCAFLWTYYGYPPCDYEGRNVDAMRYDTGVEMGESDPTPIDFVAPIPDSGTCMALGYAAGMGKPFKRGMVKYTPTWPRSFTPGTQSRRELVAKMKLIPNPSLIKGKNVLFCDDSIVRGTQLRDNVADLREAGAGEVHIRISCPPLIYPCRFINFTSSKSPMELIARRVIARLEGHDPAAPETSAWEPSAELLERYATTGTNEYNMLVEEIRKELKLDSLQFAPIETVVRAIGLPKCRICTHCFDGSSYDYNV